MPPNVGNWYCLSRRKFLHANVGYIKINKPQGNS
jgi:hypothetical protein